MTTPRKIDLTRIAEERDAAAEAPERSDGERLFPIRFEASGVNTAFVADTLVVVRSRGE